MSLLLLLLLLLRLLLQPCTPCLTVHAMQQLWQLGLVQQMFRHQVRKPNYTDVAGRVAVPVKHQRLRPLMPLHGQPAGLGHMLAMPAGLQLKHPLIGLHAPRVKASRAGLA
jgi:hypothetical protein